MHCASYSMNQKSTRQTTPSKDIKLLKLAVHAQNSGFMRVARNKKFLN